MLDRSGAVLGSPMVQPINIAFSSDETLPVRVSVLDGSTINGKAVAGDLAGRAGDTGVNNVALDSFPGGAVAHLLVKVDLSR